MFPKRKWNRIPGYNYASRRYYFVTICTHHFKRWFGNVIDGKMVLNEYGKIVEEQWIGLRDHYFNCELCGFIIMPNHIHGVIHVGEGFKPSLTKGKNAVEVVGEGFKPSLTKDRKAVDVVGEGFKPSRTIKRHGLCEMVRGFKTFSSKKITQISCQKFHWHRSFYEHIIRNDEDMFRIQEYIENNPLQWELDEYYLKL